jgi:hypothetical protein
MVAGCSDPPRQEALDASVTPAEATRIETAASSACPLLAPEAGASCPCGFACEYGSDPDLRCNTLMTGSHDQWVVSVPPAASGCDTTQPTICPATFALLLAEPFCDPQGEICVYPEARCTCSRGCGSGGTGDEINELRWCCPDVLVSSPGCPLIRPRIGSACPVSGVACDYGACAGNVNLECVEGVWENVPLGCSP